jgi:energy-coupling factor transporter ATP-binding protein EcfA2
MLDRAPSPDTIDRIGRAHGRFDLRLLGEDAERLRADTRRLVTEYLAPRIARPDAPLVVVVVGVSGSGKSTLVNSLARRRISAEGTRRPSTQLPVAWTAGELPRTLDGVRRRVAGRLVDARRPPPEGIAIVDTPPPGLGDAEGRSVALQIIDVADACVLVAGGTRYADAASFDLAARAVGRGLPTVFVLNRLPAAPEIGRVLAGDFAVKLAERSLIERPSPELIVPIAEGPVSEDTGGLPGDWVTGLRKEIEAIADSQHRPEVVAGVVSRSAENLQSALTSLRAMLIAAEGRRVRLSDPVRIAYGRAADDLIRAVRTGAYAEPSGDAETFATTLASAAARRAAHASAEVAEHWAGMAPEMVDPSQIGHGPDVPKAARERIGWWEDDLPSLAFEVAAKRLRGRGARRMVESVRRTVADRSRVPVGREARLMRRLPGVVEAARARLEDELVGILDTDAIRFAAALGPSAPDGLLAELTYEALG